MNKLDVFYPILKILREETANKRSYQLDRKIKIINGDTGAIIKELETEEFISQADLLLDKITKSSSSSFSSPDTEAFLKNIDINTLKAKSQDKSDIHIVIHDVNTGFTPQLGFSIKSKLGKPSTLFNAGDGTNFIFKVIGEISDDEINRINSITQQVAITRMINALSEIDCNIEFSGIESDTLKANLNLIDGDLSKILSSLLLYSYIENFSDYKEIIEKYYNTTEIKKERGRIKSFKNLVAILQNENPLNYSSTDTHRFYEYKLKKFLTDSALGMTPEKVWNGTYHATGGYIIVKEDGDVLCYHIHRINDFQDYLLYNTCLEQASRVRYGFGKLYKENNEVYLKINLQVRFT